MADRSKEYDLDINEYPGFHILISMIEIWTPQSKKEPNSEVDGSRMRICEVDSVQIDESFKKLISTASVRFPRGTVIRKTVTTITGEEDGDYEKITAKTDDSGVLEETRTSTSVAKNNTFSLGQRIRIYLGYTTDPSVAEMAKTNKTGKTVYNDDSTYNEYKKHLTLMFDGYITKISIDTPIELECENLAHALKTITCPDKVTLKKCEVKDLLGDDGRYKLLEGTGLKLHSNTAQMDFDLGGVELPSDWTVADLLTSWSKHGLLCYVGDDNGQPAIQIFRAYFSNPGKDSILKADTTPTPVKIHFDYHVANNGLTLTSSDKNFLAVQATGLDEDDKFIKITVIRNPDYDRSKPQSDANAEYRYVNESKLSKKAIKAGKTYISSSQLKVDMKLYTQIVFVSKKKPTTTKALAEEAYQYLEGYTMTGIEGSLTLFGDLFLHTARQVQLLDWRFPGKEGTYLVEEVHTTFGVDGFRQRITLPYCIFREGNQNKQQ